MQFERWTIDELTDTTATLLRSRWLPALAAALPASASAEGAVALAAGLWSEEVDSVLDAGRLEAYIRRAVAANGQTPRELREGDVFTVESDDFLPLDDFRRPEHTVRFVRTCGRRVRRLVDDTAAQRQVTGMAYRQVLEQSPAPPP